MNDLTTRQRRLFLVYVKDRGTCAVCGKQVRPDEASAYSAGRSSSNEYEDLRSLQLAHVGCRH